MVTLTSLGRLLLVLLVAPLLLGLVGRVKAWMGRRRGAPLLQRYFDLAKLVRKGLVLSKTTTVFFFAGPAFSLSAVIAAFFLVPIAGEKAAIAFPGDFLLLAALLAVGRVATMLAAWDTGSSFEGMGASREGFISSLSEAPFFLSLLAMAVSTKATSLSAMTGGVSGELWSKQGSTLVLLAAVLFLLSLAENARVPFDDPTTHLELTMVHEVMVLDHSGPLLALVEAAVAVKMALFATLLVDLVVPWASLPGAWKAAVFAVGLLLVAVAVGVVESIMARLRLVRVPHLLAGGLVLALAALLLVRS
ncbi:respiratory chain complex I subunit 1 family protein [Thermoanaerobaculum aquaticum]|nr:NADH-quinone oxidoreductase subunit H [Thermoanaerobaculum aquaticum]